MSSVIVTYLEMKSLAELRPRRIADPRFAVREATEPQWQLNRLLYLMVGEDWNWTDRRPWSDERWREYVASPSIRTFVACYDGSLAGYYELGREASGDVEIVYFGLTPPFIGRGFGAAMLTQAIEDAWAWPARRLWLHTCTHDHPGALQNYQSRGFTIYHVEERRK